VCTLLALRVAGTRWVAANRDEQLDRPWQPPGLLVADPPVLGGLDLVGLGSWLAVNREGGFVVGVTNALRGASPGVRSRGQLVLELAMERSLAEAVALLTELDLASDGPANLLLADRERVWLATNAPEPRLLASPDAVVALRNEPLDEAGASTRWAAGLAQTLILEGETSFAALESMLARHDGPDPICRHGQGYGTVCSSVLRLGPGGAAELAFAPGPPCREPFGAIAALSDWRPS